MTFLAGEKKQQFWADQIVVGGSDPLQRNNIILDGSGTTATVVAQTLSGATLSVTNVGATTVVGATLSGGQLLIGGSGLLDSTYATPGSPYFDGTIARFTTETVISGGMWVTVSGAAGGAAVKARAAAASTQGPIGIAIATVGSNATVSILTRGYAYLTAEATLANGEQIKMGAGAALNCVLPLVAGSAARGVALAGAGSEGKALVYLW